MPEIAGSIPQMRFLQHATVVLFVVAALVSVAYAGTYGTSEVNRIVELLKSKDDGVSQIGVTLANELAIRVATQRSKIDPPAEIMLLERVCPLLVKRLVKDVDGATGTALGNIASMSESIERYMKRKNLTSLNIDVEATIRGVRASDNLYALRVLTHVSPLPDSAIKFGDEILKKRIQSAYTVVDVLMSAGERGRAPLLRVLFDTAQGNENAGYVALMFSEVVLSSETAHKIVLELGESGNPEIRWRAAASLRKSVRAKLPSVVDWLTKMLSDSEIASQAAEALGSGGPAMAHLLPRLQAMLGTESEAGAAAAIFKIGPKVNMVGALAARLTSRNSLTGKYCLKSLTKLGPSARSALPHIRKYASLLRVYQTDEKELVKKAIEAISGKQVAKSGR